MASLPPWLTAIYVFVLGAVVGSFLNVVIARVPRGESLVKPRSRCPGCRSAIAWYDNVPIVSWLLLRGKCRRCGTRISPRYLVVELAGGLLALACLRQFGLTYRSAALFVFLCALLALTYIDVDHWLLPRRITAPFIGVGLLASLLPGGPGIASSALGAAVGFAALALVGFVAERLLKKEALGGGDVWLLSMIGAWLGLRSLLPVILLASVQGAIVGGLLLALKGRLPEPKAVGNPEVDEWTPPEGAVPFGPFLAFAGAEFVFFGDRLLDWYLGLLAGVA